MSRTEKHLIRGIDMAQELRAWSENVSDQEMRDTLKLGADEIDALRAARDAVGNFWSAACTARDAYRAENERLRGKLETAHKLLCEANAPLAKTCRGQDADVDKAASTIALAIRLAA